MKAITRVARYTNRNGVPCMELSDGETTLKTVDYDKLEPHEQTKKWLDSLVLNGAGKMETQFLPDGSSVHHVSANWSSYSPEF